MALNPKYVTAPSLQSYFVDKDTGQPLSGGRVFFYSDENRTQYKDVYELQGNQANYTYVPLPNPIVLSQAGTIQDNNGNDVLPYYKPWSDADENIPELYYIVVQNAEGVPQFTRQAYPNPTTGSSGSATESALNFIPNGQMLAHTDLPNNTLVPGTNVIAQGGISIELDDNLFSTNTLVFEETANQNNAPNSPRYIANYTCTAPTSSENLRAIRVKWLDVNKFSLPDDPVFTFGFWGSSNIEIPYSIDIVKNYGTNGDPETRFTVATGTIISSPDFYSHPIQFGINPIAIIDDVNNDDFVAVEIKLSTNIGFSLEFSDLTLLLGETILTSFPLQTNADMLTRGVAGWMPTPRTNGYDLGLPLVLTREGMKFDDTDVGKIFADSGESSATDNVLKCDGSSYLGSAFSATGIPYGRLRDKLISKSPVPNYPLYGTGSSFVTARKITNNIFVLAVNSPGTPVFGAADGATLTNFGFESTVTYNASTVGAITKAVTSASSLTNYLVTRGNTIGNVSVTNPTTPFSVANFDTYTGLFAEQNRNAFAMTTTAGSTLTASPSPYINVATPTGNFFIYYSIGAATAPVGVGTPIRLRLTTDFDAPSVAFLTACALNSYQMTTLTISSVPAAGSYFTFQANPASIQNYHVWYSVNGSPSNVSVANSIGIKVDLNNSDTAATVLEKTIAAINAYQFAVPDLRGMFARGVDPTAIWDTDNFARFGFGSAIGGSNYGTYEFQQLLSHNHVLEIQQSTIPNRLTLAPAPLPYDLTGNTTTIRDTGGNETRPVNFYVNWVIKY